MLFSSRRRRLGTRRREDPAVLLGGKTPPGGAVSPDGFDVVGPCAALAGALLVWSLATLLTGRFSFAFYAPKLQLAVGAAADIALLFGALVLSMFITERSGDRLLWVAGGLLVSGLGGLAFEYADVLAGASGPNAAAYESLFVWTVAATLFAVGLVPREPPRLRRGPALAILAAFALGGFALAGAAHLLPPLVPGDNPAGAGGGPLWGATGWNVALAAVPLALAVAAALGAAALYRRGALGGWLVVAMVLLAGSQLRSVFQPPAYGSVLTVADGLHLAFAAVVALGGVLKLRRIAAERAALLAAEKETNQRLGELSVMKADFTSMVAHELGSPLLAIRALAGMVSTDELDKDARKGALEGILSETAALDALVCDVRAAGAVERDDFSVELRPVPLGDLLSDAKAFSDALPGSGPTKVVVDGGLTGDEAVLADRERVGQALRNLLGNAAKYSPGGSPVELRAAPASAPGRVRLEVSDRGVGIHPDDLARIFEKFGRGRDEGGRKVPGVGLGLYLSRRIVRCHGSELTAGSRPGEGSTFAFELEGAG